MHAKSSKCTPVTLFCSKRVKVDAFCQSYRTSLLSVIDISIYSSAGLDRRLTVINRRSIEEHKYVYCTEAYSRLDYVNSYVCFVNAGYCVLPITRLYFSYVVDCAILETSK